MEVPGEGKEALFVGVCDPLSLTGDAWGGVGGG